MSNKAVAAVVDRWILDCDFRAHLANDPQATLADYDLTQEERKRLSKIKVREAQLRKPRKAVEF